MYFSTTSVLITSRNKLKPIAYGTGFFIKVNSNFYLITNNHVLGGKFYVDEYKKDHKGQLPPKQNIPDSLEVRIYGAALGSSGDLVVGLYQKGKPIWRKMYENENDTSTLLDIASIPLGPSLPEYLAGTHYLDSLNLNKNLKLDVGSELFVVGFPGGQGDGIYPIWKRGTIASEPNLRLLGDSRFYIDATTRKGMSGSPVFYRGTNYQEYDGKGGIGSALSPLVTFLVGIYSAQSYEFELGLVTRLDKVFETLSRNP